MLDDFEAALLPCASGGRMLHLACANGNDSLSWAALGFRVTGVDISEVAIERASQLARDTGLDARFVTADMYQLPDDLGDFDVVYASWGVVCWLPDLDRWASMIAERLRPRGNFLLCEHHPIWEMLAVNSGAVEVTIDYFGRGSPTRDPYDQSKRPSGSTSQTAFSAFVWPISDVLMALVHVGLVIDEFFEAPKPTMYDGLGAAASRLPAIYVIKATKP